MMTHVEPMIIIANLNVTHRREGQVNVIIMMVIYLLNRP